MRKRNFMYYCDTLFWYIVYMLPVIVMLLAIFRTGTIVSMSYVFTEMNLSFVADNIVFNTINDVFGVGGTLPIFQSSDIILFLTYFVDMIILHQQQDVK